MARKRPPGASGSDVAPGLQARAAWAVWRAGLRGASVSSTGARPSWRARVTRSLRRPVCVLRRRFSRWVSTVRTLSESRRATSLLLKPALRKRRTSASRGVSPMAGSSVGGRRRPLRPTAWVGLPSRGRARWRRPRPPGCRSRRRRQPRQRSAGSSPTRRGSGTPRAPAARAVLRARPRSARSRLPLPLRPPGPAQRPAPDRLEPDHPRRWSAGLVRAPIRRASVRRAPTARRRSKARQPGSPCGWRCD
ncbi:hypothetical protein MSPGM_19580 [Methylorubrum sp. GM97]|nr:hypothetical protein MSPGM_19580 [Methylorubrum sp. GM97]